MKKKYFGWSLVILIFLGGIMGFQPVFWGIPTLEYRYIDINSGRIYEKKLHWGIFENSVIKETTFSKRVAELGLNSSPPDWKKCNRFAQGIFCFFYPKHTTYKYGGVIEQCKLLMESFAVYDIKVEKQDEILKAFIALLKKEESQKKLEQIILSLNPEC